VSSSTSFFVYRYRPLTDSKIGVLFLVTLLFTLRRKPENLTLSSPPTLLKVILEGVAELGRIGHGRDLELV
jgi:hypothetical protein